MDEYGRTLPNRMMAAMAMMIAVAIVLPIIAFLSIRWALTNKPLPEWQKVAPGAELVILDEITVRNTAPIGSQSELEVSYREDLILDDAHNKRTEVVELNFRSQPNERMSFELLFDFEKFGFQPKLTNATLSVEENNQMKIATIKPTETPQTIQVALARQ